MTKDELIKRIKESYKHDRLGGRGKEYESIIYERAWKEYEEYGVVFISKHESITGEAKIIS